MHKSNRKWVTGKQASFISRIATMNHRILIVATIFEMQTPRRPIDGACPRRACEFTFKAYLYIYIYIYIMNFYIYNYISNFIIYIFLLCNIVSRIFSNSANSLLKKEHGEVIRFSTDIAVELQFRVTINLKKKINRLYKFREKLPSNQNIFCSKYKLSTTKERRNGTKME